MSAAMNENPVMGSLEWGLLLTLSVLWGGSFFFTEVALAELPPFTIVLGRVGFAAVALVLVASVTGHRLPLDLRLWGAFLVMGALNNLIPFCLIVWGQTRIGSGLASILNATTPLFTILIAHALTADEKLTPGRLAGVLLGLAGVTVMIGGEVLAGLGPGVVAQLAVLGAALSYAFAGIFGRRFKDTAPLVTAAGQVTATTLLMLPLALVVDRPWSLPMPSLTAWGTIGGLALLSTAAAYVIYFRILAAAGATNLLLVTFLIPVSAVLLAVSVLGERLAPGQLAGMALIGLGLAAIDGRPLRSIRLALRRNFRPARGRWGTGRPSGR